MVNDPNRRSLGIDRDKRNAIILLAFVGLSTLGAYFPIRNIVDSWLGSGMIPTDRIGMASVLVMQIDSFLVAGYVIGFFRFQGDMSRKIQTIAMLDDKELSRWRDEKGTKYFTSVRFLMSMLVIALFVLSGLYAVRATLFETRDELVASLSLLVMGAVLMVGFWGVMVAETESMAEQIGNRIRKDSGRLS